MKCAISECGNNDSVFTLCAEHRRQFGVEVRRKAKELPRRDNPLPPIPARPPRPLRSTRYRQLTTTMIHHVRAWYRVTSLRWVAAEIGVQASTVQNIVRAVPGDPVRTRTHDRLVAWMVRLAHEQAVTV